MLLSQPAGSAIDLQNEMSDEHSVAVKKHPYRMPIALLDLADEAKE